MKKVPLSVWILSLVLVGILALVGLTLATQKQTFTDVKFPIEITEYFDYQCPHCAEFHPTLKELAAKYGDKLQITYKHYPFLNNDSYEFAYAAEAAREQGKFQEYHYAIMDLYVNILAGTAQAQAMNPVTIAEQLGLEMGEFNQDRADATIQQRVQASKADGAKVGVTSTPTVFVFGKKVEAGKVNTATNKVEYTVFTDLIDQLVSKAEANTNK